MTKKVFIDTGYLIGIFSRRDQYHEEASRIADSTFLENTEYVISEMVIAEFLNKFASMGKELRDTALRWVDDVISEPNTTEVVEQNHQLFIEAKNLYGNRMDKKCGLTDCASFLIMKDKKIQYILSFDRDFDQEGFSTVRLSS